MQPLRFGPLTLPSRYLLAPLAGYTNLPFRLAVRELGGLGLATTDLVNARALLPVQPQDDGADADLPRGPARRRADLRRRRRRRCATPPSWLEDYGVSSVDINMGCPVHKVTRGGGGSAMMCDAGGTVRAGAHGGRGGAASR